MHHGPGDGAPQDCTSSTRKAAVQFLPEGLKGNPFEFKARGWRVADLRYMYSYLKLCAFINKIALEYFTLILL